MQEEMEGETTKQVNKYGFTKDEWAQLDPRVKKRVYWKFSRLRRRAEDPEKFAAKSRARDLKRRHRDIEAARKRGRERYQRTRESQLAHAKSSYYRNLESRRQGSRERHARYTSIAQIRRSPEKLYKLIAKAIPAGLAYHDDRADLIGAMCLAVLEGKLLVKNIKASVANFLRAHNREYDTFKTLSLDEQRPDGKGAWVDHVTAEDLPW